MSQTSSTITAYNGDLITIYYYNTPSLYAATSKAMIVLSAVAIVGCHLHYAKYRFIMPYIILNVVSLVCLLQAGLQLRVSAGESISGIPMSPPSLSSDTTAAALASQFFGLVYPPLAWCIVLDSFRLSQARSTTRVYQMALGFGYLWTLTMIVGAIACVSVYHLNGAEMAFSGLFQFVTYGLWVFVGLFILDSYIAWTRVKHFYKGLAVYALLLVLVNIGRAASLVIILQQQMDVMSADVTTAFKIDFALSRIVGILAIYWAILVCHRWRTIKENNNGTVHHQEILSVITDGATHGELQIEHVVLDVDGGASNKGLDWSKLQISRTTTNEQDNTSLVTVQDKRETVSSTASSSNSIESRKAVTRLPMKDDGLSGYKEPV
ncbi:hypothetical protein BX666DRAFT_2027784 [Dichotomocladium elegans]|nr:hypothetical protein BX666DRAFT_2027784 [Dichotomocladium elegans]